MRKFLAAVVLAAPIFGLVQPAWAALSVVPIPEILTDPNEGNTYGVLPVLLLLDPQGRLEHIVAHDIRYNRITGWYAAFRLFGYPTLDQRYFVTLRKSQRIDEDYIGEYENDGLFGGAGNVLVNVTYWRDSRLRFFGFGNESPKNQETNYTQKRFARLLRFGYRPQPSWELAWQGRYEEVSIQHGGVREIPFLGDVFPRTQGIEGSTVHGEALSISYDDRDEAKIPTRGTLGAAHVEFVDRALGNSQSFVNYGFEVREFVPFRERFVLAIHSAIDYLSGANQAPFYERNSLGGVKNLRGFGDDRFIDAHRFFSSVELRTQAFRRQILDVLAEFEVAPFVDAGQVFSSLREVPIDDLHVVAGMGFRGVVRPQVVGFVDVGYGSDGPAIFTGLDYPF